jgi:excisionase family DNA binding protein
MSTHDDRPDGRSVEQAPPRSFLTIRQLAARWHVSPRTIRRKINTGELRAVRIGRQLRVPVREAERYEALHATGPWPA